MTSKRAWWAVILACTCCCGHSWAEEPNNTFAEATVLAPGVLSVSDALDSGGGGNYPDTMLASFSTFGTFITGFNDDGGPWEGSLGSALTEIPVNNDSSILFSVTGNPDFNFTGDHGESGAYRVYLDIYDQFFDLVDDFVFDEFLQPGEVDDFYLDGFNTNYTYNVSIDNTIGGSLFADVDFFTFTGLTPGESFAAEVTQASPTSFDSVLGWFNDLGNLLEIDDDGGVGNLSLISGIVPASGKLTFAVTGYSDFDFIGEHSEDAEYTLQLTLGSSTSGDFDGDGDVDGRDFLLWQRGISPAPLSAGDLADWQANYGNGSLAAVAAVPEPGSWGLLAMAICGGLGRRTRC